MKKHQLVGWLLGGYAAVAGCGSRDPIVLSPQEIPAPAGGAAGLAYESPARWVYAPATAADPLASLALRDGRCILAGDRGERWVTQRRAGKNAPCSGVGQAAGTLAPEALIGIVKRNERSWLFIGQSGTLYEADGPLSPFSRRIRPPRPFERVTGVDTVLLAVSSDGRLQRWDEAGAWERIPLGAGAGEGVEGRVVDVAVAPDHRALALTLPETLWTSTDAGKTWTRVPETSTPSVGAHRLGVTPEGQLVAVGVTKSLVWRDRSGARLEVSTERLDAPPAAGSITVGTSRSVEAMFEGRAQLTKQRYYEVRAGHAIDSLAEGSEEERESFYLLSGKLEGALGRALLPESRPCEQVRLGASDRTIVVTCTRTTDDRVLADVRKSRDGGKTWAKVATLRTSRSDEVRIAVGLDGQALITAVCPDEERDPPPAAAEGRPEKEKECGVGAPILVTPDDEVVEATAPHLLDLAMQPAFSPDGQRAYFLARRLKDERFAIFASRDGGRSFTQRAIELPHLEPPSPPEGEEAPTSEAPYDPAAHLEVGQRPIAVDDDGLLSVTALLEGTEVYLFADEDGRVVRASRPPVPAALMAGVGPRVLAIGRPVADPNASEQPLARSWESLDGGETWSEIPATLALESAFEQGLVCEVGGCIVGSSVARLGWGGQVETFSSAMDPDPLPESRRAVRTPLLCELTAEAGWRTIPHVYELRLPTLSESFRGSTAWSTLAFDPEVGAVDAYAMTEAEGGAKGRLLQKTMFKPSGRGSPVAVEITLQMEGYAAARARISVDAAGNPAPGGELRDLEIAWENWMDGTTGRRTLPNAGPLEPSHVERRGDAFALTTELLSVSPGGIFVRPSSSRSDVFFLDPKSKVEKLAYADWSTLAPLAPVRPDAAAVGPARLSVGQVYSAEAGALVGLLARQRASGEWDVSAQTIGPLPTGGDTRSFLDWTYQGDRIGLTVTVSDPRSLVAWSSFFGFQEDGKLAPPVALPTPFDVDDRIRPCTVEEKKATARVDAPVGVDGASLFPGTRHPIVVLEPSSGSIRSAGGAASLEPFVLLSDGMILHGTKKEPCVAGWHATGIQPSPDTTAVVSGDLRSAWLFRMAPSDETGIEYRAMTCRFDPTMAIPDQVWQNDGTTVWR